MFFCWFCLLVSCDAVSLVHGLSEVERVLPGFGAEARGGPFSAFGSFLTDSFIEILEDSVDSLFLEVGLEGRLAASLSSSTAARVLFLSVLALEGLSLDVGLLCGLSLDVGLL